VRIVGLVGAAQFLLNEQVQFIKTWTLAAGYGTELALVIGAVGLAFAMKSAQESKAPSPTQGSAP